MIEANKQEIYRVLIVDENAAMREMLAGLLRAPNRSVEVRDGARAALEFVQHNPIDVAFVDAALDQARPPNTWPMPSRNAARTRTSSSVRGVCLSRGTPPVAPRRANAPCDNHSILAKLSSSPIRAPPSEHEPDLWRWL